MVCALQQIENARYTLFDRHRSMGQPPSTTKQNFATAFHISQRFLGNYSAQFLFQTQMDGFSILLKFIPCLNILINLSPKLRKYMVQWPPFLSLLSTFIISPTIVSLCTQSTKAKTHSKLTPKSAWRHQAALRIYLSMPLK